MDDEQFQQQFVTLAQQAATVTSRDIIDLLNQMAELMSLVAAQVDRANRTMGSFTSRQCVGKPGTVGSLPAPLAEVVQTVRALRGRDPEWVNLARLFLCAEESVIVLKSEKTSTCLSAIRQTRSMSSNTCTTSMDGGLLRW